MGFVNTKGCVMYQGHEIDLILLSPKTSEFIDYEAAHNLLEQLETVTARPHQSVELKRRGDAKAWGVELTSEDGRTAYRVVWVIEEGVEPDSQVVLSILAAEEKKQLEARTERRMKLKGWVTIRLHAKEE
jgi:hypothetical protein